MSRLVLPIVLVAATLAGCRGLDARARRGAAACEPCPEPCEAGVASPVSSYRAAALRHGAGRRAIGTYLAERYDTDGDGRLTAGEYTRDAAVFRRLDTDGDGVLTPADFRGPTSMEDYLTAFVRKRLAAVGGATTPEVGPEGAAGEGPLTADELARGFAAADANRNGRVGEREILEALRAGDARESAVAPRFPRGVAPFPSMLAALDTDGGGDLSRAEADAGLARTQAERALAQARRARVPAIDAVKPRDAVAKAGAEATAGVVAPPRSQGPETRRGAAVGEEAPPFTLKTADGTREVSLASFQGVKPVVLIFGSYTCPPFRDLAGRLRAIEVAYGEAVQFFFVYIREAHAVDGPSPMPSDEQPIVESPRTLEERRLVASSCFAELGFDRFPTLVDGLDDAVNRAYAAGPARIYVVGKDGKVAYQSGPGPFGLDADALEAAVVRAAR